MARSARVGPEPTLASRGFIYRGAPGAERIAALKRGRRARADDLVVIRPPLLAIWACLPRSGCSVASEEVANRCVECVEYVFAPAFDGIDDPDTYEGSQLGIRRLHPSAWFEPFQVEAPVHPLLR